MLTIIFHFIINVFRPEQSRYEQNPKFISIVASGFFIFRIMLQRNLGDEQRHEPNGHKNYSQGHIRQQQDRQDRYRGHGERPIGLSFPLFAHRINLCVRSYRSFLAGSAKHFTSTSERICLIRQHDRGAPRLCRPLSARRRLSPQPLDLARLIGPPSPPTPFSNRSSWQ